MQISQTDGDDSDFLDGDEIGENMDEDDDGSPASPNAMLITVQDLYDTGDFKVNPEFDVYWQQAWWKAQSTARITALSSRKKLLSFDKDAAVDAVVKKAAGCVRKGIMGDESKGNVGRSMGNRHLRSRFSCRLNLFWSCGTAICILGLL